MSGRQDSSNGATDVTGYFTGLAATYDAHRPSYAAGAIDAIVSGLPRPIRAADVGCGTGISTRLLAQAGVEAIGVEPNDDMRAEAARVGSPIPGAGAGPGRIEYRRGAAEKTGLPAQSVDLVVCAQAFHWFEPEPALREFHRILRAQGRLALMWNLREDGNALSATYNALMKRAQAAAEARGQLVRRHREADPTIGGWFARARTVQFPNPQQFDREGLLGRARSASYWPRETPLRCELERELLAAYDEHAVNGIVAVAQRTKVTLAERA